MYDVADTDTDAADGRTHAEYAEDDDDGDADDADDVWRWWWVDGGEGRDTDALLSNDANAEDAGNTVFMAMAVMMSPGA